MSSNKCKGLLLVANWDSNVGYAWWLMESFWVVLSEIYQNKLYSIIAYPSISIIPDSIAQANIEISEYNFTKTSISEVVTQCKFIISKKIRVIYFSDHTFWHWRYIAFRLCGVKIILTHDHTPGLRSPPKGIKKALKMLISRLPFVTCNAIIGVTKYIQQRAIEVTCIPKHKTYYATNGLPKQPKTEPLNLYEEFAIPRNQKILITTGRAATYKGIPFAIDCINKIVHEYHRHDIHLLFCGDGPDLEKFKIQSQNLNLQNHVSMPGNRPDIANILLGCDFAIHPSAGEVGYSLSILEYMRASLPVIVSNNPSVCGATTHNETGLIYQTGDINSACDMILMLLNDPALAKKLGANAKTASQIYSLDKTHADLISALHSIDHTLTK